MTDTTFTPENHPPKVAIVILNWNGMKDTLECLASVNQLDYTNYEAIVVDNGSSDNSVDAITNQYPDITLLQTGANLGFAGGNNVGIRHALAHGADLVFLLNNDTIVDQGLLKALTSVVDSVPEAGIFGAKIFFHSEPNTLWYAGARWIPERQAFEHVGLGQIDDNVTFDSITETDYITGCALLIKADVIKHIGVMDEKFFLTYEETDWCYRARAAGHKCIFVPQAKLWHKVSASFGGAESPLVHYFMTRNRLLWATKHLSRSAQLAFFWRELVKTLRSIFPSFAFRSQGGAKSLYWSLTTYYKALMAGLSDPVNRAQLFGIRDFVLRRFGDCPKIVRKLGK